MKRSKGIILAAFAAPGVLSASQVWAEGQSGTRAIEEIVVTAQKREESINDVGMSIQAATGEQLKELGITDVSDLFKVAAGFNSNVTQYGTPVYTIRGVGFQELSLATSPTVSVYLDEAPLQFAPMTKGVTLDTQRVEVLKGPQGTLFGQNATGGAVNFVANKPTREFEAGATLSYGKFDYTDLEGFVSGPISNGWGYRLAARIQRSDDWQKSYVSGDEAGERDEISYRATLAYDDDDRLRMRLTLSGFEDESDVLRPQLSGKVSQNPDNGLPDGFLAVPLAPNDARAADWSPCANIDGGSPGNTASRQYNNCIPLSNDTSFFSAQLRADYDLNDQLVLTSLTSYNDYDRDGSGVDQDGTVFQIYETAQRGSIETIFQEFRLTGTYGPTNWVVGANYEDIDSYDEFIQSFGDSSVVPIFGFIDFGPNRPNNKQDVETYAIFGNIEHRLNDAFSVQAGLRYTDQKRDFVGCTNDGGDGTWALTSFLIQPFLGSTSPILVEPGECATTGSAPTFNPPPNGHEKELDEDNTSWRVGMNWSPSDQTLVYANISKGYKNGQFPTLSGSAGVQLEPVVQEELLAYEIGVKTLLLDQTLQLNAATFYYDYKDKQIRGALIDEIFGSLSALVNVPESHVVGFEVLATWMPIDGLRIEPSVSYADSEVDGTFRNFDPFFKPTNGGTKDFSGQDFPQAPELQANLAVSYSWPAMDGWTAFVKTNINYQEETTSFFVDKCKEPGVPCTRTDADILVGDSDLPVPDRTLIDLQLGIENENWRMWLWGRNLNDEYYWTRHVKVNDSIVQFAGMPRTYGVTVSYTH